MALAVTDASVGPAPAFFGGAGGGAAPVSGLRSAVDGAFAGAGGGGAALAGDGAELTAWIVSINASSRPKDGCHPRRGAAPPRAPEPRTGRNAVTAPTAGPPGTP